MTEAEQKEAKRRYNFEYGQRHRARLNSNQKEYYRAHKDQHRKTCDAWLNRNREKMLEYYREYNRTKRDPEKRKTYYAKKRKWLLARQKSRNQSNREKYLARWKSVNLRRRDKIKEYRLQRKEHFRKIHHAWCVKNRASRAASARAYRKRNPDKVKAWNLKRSALERKATINLSAIQSFVSRVKSKRTIRCYYCSKTVSTLNIHFDHIIPIIKGGPHSVENLCVSCPSCNLSKKDKTIDAWVRVGQQVLHL